MEILSELALSGGATDYLNGAGGWTAFPAIPTVSDTAYNAASWNGNTDAPTKNAVRDKFESLSFPVTIGNPVSDGLNGRILAVGLSAGQPVLSQLILGNKLSIGGANLNVGQFTIGEPISGGTNNRVLYQSGGNVAQSANFTYDGAGFGAGGSAGIGTNDYSNQDSIGVGSNESTQLRIVGKNGSIGYTAQLKLLANTSGVGRYSFFVAGANFVGTTRAGNLEIIDANSIAVRFALQPTGNFIFGDGLQATGAAHKLSLHGDVTYPSDLVSSQLTLAGTNTAKKLVLGYDTNGNGFGFIAAGYQGVTWTNLALQPNGGNVGIGTTAPAAKAHIVSTTEQLRIGYDASNYFTAITASNGAVTFDAVGAGAKFIFSDAIQPASIADSAAANNSIYYSTTAGKLVYKDGSGTVNNLY